MISRTANVAVVTLLLVLAVACSSDADLASTTSTTSATSTPEGIDTIGPVESTVAPPASTEPTEQPAPFPIASFAAISEDPVTAELAAAFQAALEDSAGRPGMGEGGGMTATVMTADGTWSGALGTADGVRDLRVEDQFSIASITKSLVAAQVMLMVEAGELGLDDPVADHLPDLEFDTNGATIRDLLSHRSGIPDDYEAIHETLRSDPLRVWTADEVLEQLPKARGVAGRSFEYSGTNYLLLGLVIEQVRGRPVADVLRDGALAVDGLERLVIQPDEKPTEPMAMPGGASSDALDKGGGYLPSLASVSAFPTAGGIASDAPSLARWWKALCAGEVVSQASLTEMAAFDPDVSSFDGSYGLGLFNPVYGQAEAVGHQGELFGYMSWAACLPEQGTVIVVLTNRPATISVELFFGMLRPFVDVARARQSVGLPQSVFGDTLTFTSPPVRERGDGRIEIPLTANTDGRIIIGEDPGPDSIAREGCWSGAYPPPAGDTAELARRIGADPDFETTDTQPVSIAGLDGLQVDATFRTLDLCYGMWSPSRNGDGGGGPRVHQPILDGGWRIRVYMVDYPEWALSETNWRPRVLTVAVIAPENDFEGVLKRAMPIIDSLEFRPG